MKPIYILARQIDPPGASKSFRIIETRETCDGMRSRLTNWCFAAEQDAQAKLTELRLRAVSL